MSEEPIARKLTAILYADVAGYSRLTGDDELGTHRAVMDALDFTAEAINAHGGTVLRWAGDAVLAEYPSVVACVNAAVAIQTELDSRNDGVPEDKRIMVRMGINLGEVLIDRGQTRIGFEFKAGASTTPRDWAHLQAGIADKVIDKGILVYNGTRTFPASDKIRVVPAAEILTTAAKW